MSGPRSIFWRSFAVFALSAILPIAAVAVQGYHCARQAMLDDRLHLLRQLSALKRDELEAGLRERARAVGIFADLPAVRESAARPGDPAPANGAPAGDAQPAGGGVLRGLLEDPGRKWIGFQSAGIFDLAGRALGTVGPAGPGDLWDEEARNQAADSSSSGLPVPGPVRAREPGRPSMRVTASIHAGDGRPAATLVAAIDLADTVAAILGNEGEERDGQIRTYILGTDGTPLSAVPGGPAGIRAVLAEPPTRFSHEGCASCSKGSCHFGEYAAPDGVWVVGACYPSRDRKWMAVSESPVESTLASLRSFVNVSLTTSGIALLAMLLAGALLARRISAPIRSVAEAANRIAGGDLSSRASYRKRDEVGALVAAFNSLVDGLITSREETRSRNRELESVLAQLSEARDRLIQTESISAVGRVAASLVHEIRNPLSSVKMNLQILSRPVAGDARLAEHARIARDQVERLERMLTDLLDFGRPLELRLERVRLADSMARAKADMEARAAERGVAVIAAGPTGIELEADPSRIAQVLVNLLANAIDASPRGGRVTIEASERILDGRRWVSCEVRDSGPGIRPEHHEAIFDPFFTTKEGGTGLGLSMVKKIAALHGGRVEVESEPGRGTVMRLVLPGGAAGP